MNQRPPQGAAPAGARSAARTARLAIVPLRAEHGAPQGSGEVWLNWVLLRLVSGEPIGTLQATVRPGSHAWIGYALAASAWGRGFASEACAWLVADLPARYDVREALASVDVRNARSIALLERLGFVRVATEAAELHGEASADHRYRLAC